MCVFFFFFFFFFPVSKIIEGPEIREALHELPLHARFVDSLYNCQYESFFKSLAEVRSGRDVCTMGRALEDRASSCTTTPSRPKVESLLQLDRVFAEHARFYVRELRVKAYSQLLQSYRSVTLESMAASFGVSVPFIDRELSRFIAAGRLNCKIDKVRDATFGALLGGARFFFALLSSCAPIAHSSPNLICPSVRSEALSRRRGQTRRTRSTRR